MPDCEEIEFGLRDIFFARVVEMKLYAEGAAVNLRRSDFDELDELLVES